MCHGNRTVLENVWQGILMSLIKRGTKNKKKDTFRTFFAFGVGAIATKSRINRQFLGIDLARLTAIFG